MRMQGWGVKTIAGLGMVAGWFLACAGQDIPPIEDDFREGLEASFGGAPTGVAGSSGTAGSANAGRGGSGSSGTASGGRGGSASSGGGAAGSGAPAGGGGSGDTCDAFPILQSSCGLPGCHADPSTQGSFAATEEGVLAFVDKPSTKGASCEGSFIDSANPEDSLIYTRLSEAGCGNLSMPLTGDPLTEEQTACVLSWLGQFAQ